MSSKKITISKDNLPRTDEVNVPLSRTGIIESEDGLYRRKLQDLQFNQSSLEQGAVITETDNKLIAAKNSLANTASTISRRLPFRGAIAAYFNFNPSSNNDFIINRQTNVPLPLNHVAVNSTEYIGDVNVQSLLIANGIVIPKGTYRCRAASAFTVRNPGRYYEQEGIYVGETYGCNLLTDLFQYDSPQRSMLVSDVKHVPVNGLLGKTTITSVIDGFFHVCRTTPIGLRVSTDGNVSIGDGSLNIQYQPRPPVNVFTHYYGNSWPVQLTIELVDREDIFNLLDVNYEASISNRAITTV